MNSPVTLEIRPASASDVARLCKIGADIFYETYAAKNTEENMQLYISETYNADILLNELKDKSKHFFLAFLNGLPAGYAKMNSNHRLQELGDDRQAEIEQLYVYKQYQGQKIGYQLIRTCISLAHSYNCSYLWLGVWEHNHNSINFYEKVGFTKFGQHEFKLGLDIQTDLLMKIPLIH